MGRTHVDVIYNCWLVRLKMNLTGIATLDVVSFVQGCVDFHAIDQVSGEWWARRRGRRRRGAWRRR